MSKCKIEVNNMPEEVRKYVVARIDERDMGLWYWGSWDERDRAQTAAEEIGGVVLEADEECEHDCEHCAYLECPKESEALSEEMVEHYKKLAEHYDKRKD